MTVTTIGPIRRFGVINSIRALESGDWVNAVTGQNFISICFSSFCLWKPPYGEPLPETPDAVPCKIKIAGPESSFEVEGFINGEAKEYLEKTPPENLIVSIEDGFNVVHRPREPRIVPYDITFTVG